MRRNCKDCRFNLFRYEDYNGKEKCSRNNEVKNEEWGINIPCILFSYKMSKEEINLKQ